MDIPNIKLIEQLSNAFGPSGFEEDVVSVIHQYCENFGFSNDGMNNCYAQLKSNTGKRPLIMLDAHTDEVGFMVQAIHVNGLLSIVPIGGMHLTNLPAHSVIIRTQDGTLHRGITTSKPVHFMTKSQQASNELEIENICVDVGASSRSEITEFFGIRVGDPVVPDVKFEHHQKNGILYGKAFDNRIGCACVAETLKLAAEQNGLNIDIVGAFAAQEEVGMRGASITARHVKPDLAIVFEGSPADDTFFEPGLSQSALKNGTQIRHIDAGYISSPEFIRFATAICEEKGISYQSAVRRGGCTNAASISLADKAIPCLVLGVPTRYVHTHYNFCAVQDIQATLQLAAEVIKKLDSSAVNHILKQDIY